MCFPQSHKTSNKSFHLLLHLHLSVEKNNSRLIDSFSNLLAIACSFPSHQSAITLMLYFIFWLLAACMFVMVTWHQLMQSYILQELMFSEISPPSRLGPMPALCALKDFPVSLMQIP